MTSITGRAFVRLAVLVLLCIGGSALVAAPAAQPAPASVPLVAAPAGGGDHPPAQALPPRAAQVEGPRLPPRDPDAGEAEEEEEEAKGEREGSGKAEHRFDVPDKAQEFFALKRAPLGQRAVPVSRYLAARQRMRGMPRYSTRQRRLLGSSRDPQSPAEQAVLDTWDPLGPWAPGAA